MSDLRNWLLIFDDGGSMPLHAAFRLYYRSLCYFASKILRDKDLSEDIVSDVFAKICHNGIQFKSESELKSFLFTAVKNLCIDTLRKEKRTKVFALGFSIDTCEAESAVNREIIMAQVLQSIYAELEKLPQQCQKVFTGIFLEGKNVATVAGEMNLSRQTVLNQKARAIKLIKFGLLKKDPITYCVFATLVVDAVG